MEAGAKAAIEVMTPKVARDLMGPSSRGDTRAVHLDRADPSVRRAAARCGSLSSDGMPQPLRLDPIEVARRHWEDRWGAEPARPMAAVTSIMRAQQILLARLNALLSPLGITFPRYEALMLLSFSRAGALPLGKIGERLQVHRTSVTNIIDKLEADGLVRRIPHEADRRATLAEISEAGRRVAAEATAVVNAAAFGLSALGPQEQEALSSTLKALRIEAGDFSEGD
jgi:DNA-binding MarR family transcriptional regulator